MKKKFKKENIIISSFKESFKLAKKHSGLIILLFLLQLIFVAILFALTVNYSFKIKDKTDAIFDYLAMQDFSDEGIEKGIFQGGLLGDDPLIIHENYVQIIHFVKLLFSFILLSYIIINGLLWNFSDSLINRKMSEMQSISEHAQKPLVFDRLKKFFVYWGKFVLVAGIYIGLIGILFYRTIKSFAGSFIAGSFLNFNFISLFLLIVLLYFMYISFALIGKNKLKDIPKKTLLIGIKKIHIMLLVYLINIFVVALFTLLAGLTIDLHIIILIITNVLFIFSLVWTRIFLVLVVDKLKV